MENFLSFHTPCYGAVLARTHVLTLMTILVSAIAFVLLLTLLILIHELGHYMFARLFGVAVEEFGFGLPPKARTLFRHAGTSFTLNWVPFGGFVKLKGENETSLEERFAPGSFGQASITKRAVILLGGVVMNFLLAFLLLVFGFSVGRWVPNFYRTVEEMQAAADRGEISLRIGVYVNEVLPDSPAERAGIVKDSAIQSVDGVPVTRPAEVIDLQNGKQRVVYEILEPKSKGGRRVAVDLVNGKSGIAISAYARELSAPIRPLPTAVILSLKETKFMTVQTVLGIVNLARSLLIRGRIPEGITGIVGIAILTYSSVQEGLMTYLRLVSLLSLSLAILNILPLPALDGGRLLFVLVEGLTHRPLNRRFELATNAVGFLLLLALIIVITFNDVIHLF